MMEIILDFYGKDLADYKKFKKIIQEVRRVPGCINANPYIKESITFAGYSSMLIEWVVENEEFLFLLAQFLSQLLKKNPDSKNKVVINNVIITNEDNVESILRKLDKS